jgi:hypothetical protein
MDLQQEGVEPVTIALGLGHESVETTQIYLDANLALKRAVLDKTTPPEGKPGRYRSLHSTQVLRSPIHQSCLGAPHRVRAVVCGIEAEFLHPAF